MDENYDKVELEPLSSRNKKPKNENENENESDDAFHDDMNDSNSTDSHIMNENKKIQMRINEMDVIEV